MNKTVDKLNKSKEDFGIMCNKKMSTKIKKKSF